MLTVIYLRPPESVLRLWLQENATMLAGLLAGAAVLVAAAAWMPPDYAAEAAVESGVMIEQN